MRLALVETSSHGGLLHYTVQMGDALAERGHEVDLVLPRGNELQSRSGAARRVSVLAPHVRDPGPPPSGRVAYTARRAGIACRLLRSWARVLWQGRRGRYDALVVGSDLTISIAAIAMLLFTRMRRRPLLVNVCHNVRPFNRWGGDDLFMSRRWSLALLRRIYPRFDLIVVHGDRSMEEFRRTWPSPALAVIPHGDERIFAGAPPPPADEERILFFGDWRKVKGLPVLMAAFDQVAAERPDAKLTIAGTPAPADFDPAIIDRWAASHEGRVEVIGRYLPIQEVPHLFGRARVVVTPYVAGYQSGVVHLAMTMARAVVSSDVGDLSDAVEHEVSGFVVASGDVAAFAAAISHLLADPARAAAMGAAGRRRMDEQSSWESVAEHVEAVLEPLIGPPAAARDD